MQPNRHSRNIESIIEQIKASFSSVYLTLISIIQACVLGYWMFLVGTNYIILAPITIILLVFTFLMIITTWNEYMMGTTAFRWIPRLKDSFIPFMIGISEFFVVHNIFSNMSLWCFSMALFSFVGYLAYLNMYHSARKHPENTAIFGLLGPLPKVTEILAFSYSVIFAFLGVITHKFPSSLTVQYITVSFSGIIFGTFLYRGVLYWNRIVGTALEDK